MAGKGDKWRKGTDFSKYRNNFDQIFRSERIAQDYLDEKEKRQFEDDRDSMSYSEYLKFANIKARGMHVSPKINGLSKS